MISADLNELLTLHSHLCRRLAIAFYCIGSLDLLGELEGRISQAERESWREWVWEQQAGRQFGARRRTYSHLVLFAGGKHGTGFRPSPFMVAQGGPLAPPAVRDSSSRSHIKF